MATGLRVSWALCALLVLTTWTYAQSVAIKEDSFPNIIQHLWEKDQIRFISKVQWFGDGKGQVETELVDEAVVSGGKAGRMVVHGNMADGKIDDLTTSLLTAEAKEQKDIAARCPAMVQLSPMENDLIFPEACLEEMLNYIGKDTGSHPIKLFGLSAILANTVERNSAKLVKQPTDGKNEIVFRLDTGRGYEIQFAFTKRHMDQKLSMSNVMGLVLTIFKASTRDQAPKQAPVAQLTVLQIQDQLKDKILPITEGYSCNYCNHCNNGYNNNCNGYNNHCNNGNNNRCNNGNNNRYPWNNRNNCNCNCNNGNNRWNRWNHGNNCNNYNRGNNCNNNGHNGPYGPNGPNGHKLTDLIAAGDDQLIGNSDSSEDIIVRSSSSINNGYNYQSCRGQGSCTGQNSGQGYYSCGGTGSCSGRQAGTGSNSCSGQGSCTGENSGRAQNSCSGTGSCSGYNSGNYPGSCSQPGSCSGANSNN